MRIEPHENLTITLLNRHLFGSDRFAGSMPVRHVPLVEFWAATRLHAVPLAVPCEKKPCDQPDVVYAPCPDHAAPGTPGLITPDVCDAAPPLPPACGDGAGLPGDGSVGNLLDVFA